MTPEEAIHYLVDTARWDHDLRAVLTARRSGADDVFAWAEAEPELVVALAESWQHMAAQTPPGMDPL